MRPPVAPTDPSLAPASRRAPPGTALYVHVPFCAVKCTYCDFYSVPGAGLDISGAIDALIQEAELRAPRHPVTVFFGGGTPTWLPSDQRQRLLGALQDITGYQDSAEEVTVECNPESLTLETARDFLAAGATRLSIGVQSLDPETLQLFGRPHHAQEAFEAYATAREAGSPAISMDLIYAAPGQTPERWHKELERILALKPDHLSAYNLTFEAETALSRDLDAGRVERVSEEHELEMFWITRELCSAAGLEPYEISNYARPGRACQHNLGYWRNRDYLGIGPSAVSKLGQQRIASPRSITAWRRAIQEQGYACASIDALDGPGRLAESLWLGLRTTEGISYAQAIERADHKEPVPALERRLKVYLEEGLLEHHAGTQTLRLTMRGLPVADGIARELFAACQPEPPPHKHTPQAR